MTEPAAQLNPRKIRLGLVLISLMFAVSLLLFIVVDDVLGRAVFFAAAVLALVRGALLWRWLRREQRSQA